jgi:stalled ribosome alternative rescue factor ArfA
MSLPTSLKRRESKLLMKSIFILSFFTALVSPLVAHSETLYGWNPDLGCQILSKGVDDWLASSNGDCGLVKDDGQLVMFSCKIDGKKSVIFAVRDKKMCSLIPKVQEQFETNMAKNKKSKASFSKKHSHKSKSGGSQTDSQSDSSSQ